MVFAGNISQKKFKAQKVGPTKNKRKFGGGVGGVEKLHFPKFYVWKEKYEGCEKKPSAKIGQSKSCESSSRRYILKISHFYNILKSNENNSHNTEKHRVAKVNLII
jgi:hypothetical protein